MCVKVTINIFCNNYPFLKFDLLVKPTFQKSRDLLPIKCIFHFHNICTISMRKKNFNPHICLSTIIPVLLFGIADIGSILCVYIYIMSAVRTWLCQRCFVHTWFSHTLEPIILSDCVFRTYIFAKNSHLEYQYFGSAFNLSTLSAWSTYMAESAVLWILCTADSAPLWNWLKGQPAWNYHINFYKLSYNLNQSILGAAPLKISDVVFL